MKYLLTLLVFLFSFQFLCAQTTGTKKWEFQTDSWAIPSPAIDSDGTVYVGFGNGKLFAINSDGSQKWVYKINDNSDSSNYVLKSPAIGADGTIYVGSAYYSNCSICPGELYSINPNGVLNWVLSTSRIKSSPAISSDGTIYVCSEGGTLFAINPDSTIRWEFTDDWEFDSSPAISPDGTIYAGSRTSNIQFSQGKLFALNPDGLKKWEFNTGYGFSPAIDSDGTVYVGSENGKLFAINPDSTIKWEYQASGEIRSSPAIATDGTIYINAIHSLHAINPNGTKKWVFKTSGENYSSPSIGSNGTIYFGSNDTLYAINSDGSKKWDFLADSIIGSSPTISSDGTIYFGVAGKLYAIHSESEGLLDSPWPKFGHDNQNTGNYLHVTSIEEQRISEFPNEFVLFPMYPNPFNPSTQIKFSLPKAGKVEIAVYNVAGQFIGKLLNGKKKAGTFIISWDASNMATGMYFIRMKSGSFVKSRKCLLVK